MRNLTQTSTVVFSHANDYGALCPTQACRHAEHAGRIKACTFPLQGNHGDDSTEEKRHLQLF